MTPMLGVSFILVLFLRQYTLKRVTIKGGLSEKAGAGTTAVDEKLKVDDLEAGKGKDNDDEDDDDSAVREKKDDLSGKLTNVTVADILPGINVSTRLSIRCVRSLSYPEIA